MRVHMFKLVGTVSVLLLTVLSISSMVAVSEMSGVQSEMNTELIRLHGEYKKLYTTHTAALVTLHYAEKSTAYFAGMVGDRITQLDGDDMRLYVEQLKLVHSDLQKLNHRQRGTRTATTASVENCDYVGAAHVQD